MSNNTAAPDQLTAMKAPSGGMVANGLYYPGGKYLPRLLKRIRDVRKKAQPVQLARTEERPQDTLKADNLVPLVKAIHEGGLPHPLLDYLEEQGHPLLPLFKRFQRFNEMHGSDLRDKGRSAGDGSSKYITIKHPEGNIQVGAGRVKVVKADGKPGHVPGASFIFWPADAKTPTEAFRAGAPMRPEELHALYEHFGVPLDPQQYQFKPHAAAKYGRKLPNKVDPDQLAREEDAPPASVARVLPSGTHSFKLPTLKHEELLGMEKEYGVPEKHRLSNSEGYSYDEKTGHIKSSKLEHLHKFLDYVTNKQIPKGLKGGKLFDHLVLHAVNDARSYMPLSDGAEWYGGSVKKLDEGLHDLLSREVPFDPKSKKIENHELWGRKGEPTAALRLFKNMVGFTSNNQKPVDNLGSALKILKTGIKKNPLRPFDGMDGYNVQPLHDYLEAVTKKYGPGDHHHVGMTPEQHTAWHNKYGADLKEQSKRGGGGVSSPFSVVVGLQDEAGNIVGRRNIAGKAMTMDGKAELPPGKYKEVPFPALDVDGNLKPKGWSSRASANATHIQLLQNVIKHFGGDYEKAAAWLEQSHPHKEVEKVQAAALGRPKAKVERSGLLPHEDTPGSFIFGPKQGPFVRNISGDPQHVTQDVWWTRSINRWLGKLTKNDKAPSAPQKQLYARIARKASQELGMAPADLQAVLWYAEQHFHRLFGARNDSQDFAHAIKHALSSHGFDKEQG